MINKKNKETMKEKAKLLHPPLSCVCDVLDCVLFLYVLCSFKFSFAFVHDQFGLGNASSPFHTCHLIIDEFICVD